MDINFVFFDLQCLQDGITVSDYSFSLVLQLLNLDRDFELSFSLFELFQQRRAASAAGNATGNEERNKVSAKRIGKSTENNEVY